MRAHASGRETGIHGVHGAHLQLHRLPSTGADRTLRDSDTSCPCRRSADIRCRRQMMSCRRIACAGVSTRRSLVVCGALLSLAVAGARAQPPAAMYRVESRANQSEPVARRFSDNQLALLEKLNRADLAALERLPELVVPESWDAPELSHTVLPGRYPAAASEPKLLIVYLPGQVFGAYEWGVLVRWGPVSSGSADSPTTAGFYHLNWRSPGHTSTVDPDWFMRWVLQLRQS